MPDHDAVAAALARLANGTGSGGDPSHRTTATVDQSNRPEPASVVADAADALARLSTAAAFVDDGGEQRLSQAIDDARRRGESDIADRGDELLAVLDRFRAAADGSANPAAGRSSPDHFHRGHTTLLTGDGVESER